MKPWFFSAISLIAISLSSCKKNNGQASTLSLLQHNWSIVSINGEALRYIGQSMDYFRFGNDFKLYESMGGHLDTAAYALNPDGASLSLYPIVNGIPSNTATTYQINALTVSMLNLSTHLSIGVTALDSLKR